MAAEARVQAMGSAVHVIVVGGPAGLVARAVAMIDGLEARWSRFLPDSEISQLNASAGRSCPVSDDTMLLVERAIEGWRLTDGRFDPTVLGAVVRAGYDRSFDALGPFPTATSVLGLGCGGIVVDRDERAVTLPYGVGFDPGGIGKGLAADLVVAELLAAGAAGVCVSIGGDVRVAGAPPAGAAWQIGVVDEVAGGRAATVAVVDGAVATSTTRRRRWTSIAGDAHHVIDPLLDRPASTGVAAATVVAGTGWCAEVFATAALVAGAADGLRLVAGAGAELLLVADDGTIQCTHALEPFLERRAAA
jgi:thiamine biosynthesis lipoprotein